MNKLFSKSSFILLTTALLVVSGFFVANTAQAYTQTDFAAFDGVNIGTNSYTVSSGITATYIAGTGTVSDPVKLALTGYAPIVTPWFGPSWTTYNYVTVGIKLPAGFTGTRVYQSGVMRYNVDPNGIYLMGAGSTDLATTGAALGYLDYSFAANSNNTKKDGLVKLQVIWTVGATPEYFTIDINGLQLVDATAALAFSNATAAVVTAEGSPTQGNVNTAQTLVTALPDGAAKTDLQNRIDAVQAEIDAATPPTDKNQCKNGGWKTFTDPVFKNQGACVSFVENHKDNKKD